MTPTIEEPQGQSAQEEAQEPSGQTPAYGENNIDLPEELVNALKELLHEAERQDLYQRRVEVIRDRRNRFYERGLQHIEELLSGAFAIQTAGEQFVDPYSGEKYQCQQFLDSYNIFGRALQIIIAKLTENPPGVVFEPDSGSDPTDEQAATAAETYRIVFERYNNSKETMTSMVRMMGCSGRTVAWTRTVADEQRWGKDIDGLPQRRQAVNIYGTLESKVPVLARSLGDCPYLIITEDPHIYNAKMEHPEFAEEISESGGQSDSDQEFERLARIGALQGQTASFQITDTYDHYVEDKHVWFRPSMFMAKCLDADYQGGTLRDALQELFEGGCKAEFIGDVYVGSSAESMDDHITIAFPYAGEGMSRMAIMDPAIPIQDSFNDFMNSAHEVMTVGWPSTWLNEDYANLAFINDQDAAPYCFRALKSRPPREGKMEDMFYREPDPVIPPTFMQFMEYMSTQLLQFILAIPSAVQGAGMPDQKTKGGYQEAIIQAMGQLGVIFGSCQEMYSGIIQQAALAAAKDSAGTDEEIVIPGPNGNEIMKMSELAGGTFLAHPDTDSGYPESTAQQRVTLQTVFDLAAKFPEVGQALLSSPDNWSVMKRMFGLAELKIPEADARDKQTAEIEILLQQSPQGGDVDPLTGMATPQTSSIPVGPLDYHEWEFEQCREWMSNWPKVQRQIARNNAPGVQNVLLHAQEHQAAMAQQAMQAQAAMAAAQPQGQPGGAKPPAEAAPQPVG